MLTKSKTVIIADREILQVLWSSGKEFLVERLYENILVTPEIFDHFSKTLDTDNLKEFLNKFKKCKYKVSKEATQSIVHPIITKDEAYAMVTAMMNSYDVILDDPRKAEIFRARDIYVLRPSDIVSEAAITKEE